MSADVYMGSPYTGKAGWSWYTGSAGWMYQCCLHSLLGVSRRGDRLFINPAFPAIYPSWQMDYRTGKALYRIRFKNDSGRGTAVSTITVDGTLQKDNSFLLRDDSVTHYVIVTLTADIG